MKQYKVVINLYQGQEEKPEGIGPEAVHVGSTSVEFTHDKLEGLTVADFKQLAQGSVREEELEPVLAEIVAFYWNRHVYGGCAS